MYTKRQRITTWVLLSGLSILCGVVIEILAEIYFPNSWFHRIASFMFASGSVLGVAGVSLAFVSLALNDWNESRKTRNFVNLGKENERIFSVHELPDVTMHLPIAGTIRQTIIAPNKEKAPYVEAGETLEHIHFGSKMPKVQVMDDEFYQKLFGSLEK